MMMTVKVSATARTITIAKQHTGTLQNKSYALVTRKIKMRHKCFISAKKNKMFQ